MTSTAPARRPRHWSRVAHGIGGLLGLAGAVWIVHQLAGADVGARPAIGGAALVALGLGATGAYVALLLLLATAWWWLTGAYGPRRGMRPTVAVWTRAQIGKYVPGNVFQYVGRQTLGRRLGLGHESLLAAHLFELMGLVAAVAVIGVARMLATAASTESSGWAPVLTALAVAVLILWPLVDRVLRWFPLTARRMAELPPLPLARLAAVLALPLGLYLAFMLGAGALLFCLARLGWQLDVEPFQVIWLYALAWTAGTFSPGAPAGLGVREAAIAIGLAPTVGDERAAAIAIALRVVTVLGDVVVAGLGMLIALPAGSGSDAPAPQAAEERPALEPEGRA